MVELVRDDLPALVLGADQVLDRHSHVFVKGRTGDIPGDRGQWCPVEARGVDRHDKNGQALVLGRIRIGTGRQPDVVGVLDGTGVDLFTIDHIFIAVAHRSGSQRRQVGTGRGLGVTDREMDLAPENAR